MSVAATTTPMPPSPSMRSTRYLPASVSPGDTGAAMGYGIIAPSHSAYELTDGVRPQGPGGFEKYRSPEDPAEIRDGHRGAASGSGRTKWPRRRARRHDRRGLGPSFPVGSRTHRNLGAASKTTRPSRAFASPVRLLRLSRFRSSRGFDSGPDARGFRLRDNPPRPHR